MWEGFWLRVPYPELFIPILLTSDVAQLQHRSIYDWAHKVSIRARQVGL